MCMVMASLMYMWCKLVNKQLPYVREDDEGTTDLRSSSERNARVRKSPTKIQSYERFVSHLQAAKWQRDNSRYPSLQALIDHDLFTYFRTSRSAEVDGMASLRNGDYKPVMNLIRTLKYGYQTKREVGSTFTSMVGLMLISDLNRLIWPSMCVSCCRICEKSFLIIRSGSYL